MTVSEITERLERIAEHAVHRVGEPPLCLSLDDGIALREAADLLKKQEPETAVLRGVTWFCPRCKNPIDQFNRGEFNSFCPFCGKAVKWDD